MDELIIEGVVTRPIAGYPAYRVGVDGSVWSRYVRGGHGRLANTWRRPRFSMGRGGHPVVTLCRDGTCWSVAVHRLVLEAFAGPCPPGMEACHFPDRDPTNNALANLRWDTRKANAADRVEHGTDPKGERNGRAKLTAAQVQEIRAIFARGEATRYQLAKRFGVCWSTINRMVKGKRWSHTSATTTPPDVTSKGDQS